MNVVNDNLCLGCREEIEWIAVLRGKRSVVKIRCRNPRDLAIRLEGQTKEGWVVVKVYHRVLKATSTKETAC
jgi:hypothetical protein